MATYGVKGFKKDLFFLFQDNSTNQLSFDLSENSLHLNEPINYSLHPKDLDTENSLIPDSQEGDYDTTCLQLTKN